VERRERLAALIKKARALDRMVAVRNGVEAVAGLWVAGAFAVFAFQAPSWVVALGLGIIAASGLWIPFYILWKGRNKPEARSDENLRA